MPSSASIVKKIVKVVVLAHKSHMCDYLGGRISAAIQIELLLDRKKYQSCSVIENNKAFESILERMKKKARYIPNY